MSPYNITGLESYTSYTVNVAVCTTAGEGPMSDGISTSTLEGIPESVGQITAMRSSNSITFSWNTVEFNAGSGNYMVSLCITILIYINLFFFLRLNTLVME